MQACWIYPWTLLVTKWVDGEASRALLSPLSVVGLILLGAFSTRLIIRYLGTTRPGQVSLVLLGLLVVLLAVRLDQFPGGDAVAWLGALALAVADLLGRPTAPAVALGLGLVLWWRGVQLGSDSPSFPDVEAAFRWNVGALIGFAVVLGIGTRPSQQPAIEAQATPFVVGSFFVSLLTLALARLESLRSRSRSLALNTQWLGVLVAVTGLLILGALAIAQVLSFDLLVLATRPVFDLIGRILLVLLYILIIPLAYVIELILYWLISLFVGNGDLPPPQPLGAGDIDSFLQRLFSQVLPPEVLIVLKALGAVLILAAALLLVARALARWRPRTSETDATQEERDSVWDTRRLREALLAWLRQLFRRRLPTRAVVPPAPIIEMPVALTALTNVRELYRHLLALGHAAGSPRHVAATPFEHLPALSGTLEPVDDLEQLTAAYVQVRYAEAEPPVAEIDALRVRLERVHPHTPPAEELD
jgi:hypothetical protein